MESEEPKLSAVRCIAWLDVWPCEGLREVVLLETLLPSLPFRFVTFLAGDLDLRAGGRAFSRAPNTFQGCFCDVVLGDVDCGRGMQALEAHIDNVVVDGRFDGDPCTRHKVRIGHGGAGSIGQNGIRLRDHIKWRSPVVVKTLERN